MNEIANVQMIGADMEVYRQQKMTKDYKNVDNESKAEKVAKDMEALFIYELMKVMRETSDSTAPDMKGLGNDTYSDLFNMEVSKAMAERGIGIRQAILRTLHGSKDIDNRE